MIVMTRQQRPALAGGLVPFEEFVSAAADVLLRLATVITADPNAAQDVVQSVFERVFRDWPRISALEYPDAYVRRMVTNEALSLRRRARRIVLTDEVPEREQALDETARIGEAEELVVALRRLPPKQRAAIALRYFADLSDTQVAETMGCREATVRGYVLRGLRRLRVDLDEGEQPLPSTNSAALPPRADREER